MNRWLEWLEWLEGTGVASIARESLYGFQILVAIHILGIVVSVGMLLWVDLRMMGFGLASRGLSEVYRAFARWFVPGYVVMFVSGSMLFAGFATSASANFWFRLKLVLIVLAGINAIRFHRLLGRLPVEAEHGAPPASVRLAGGLSLAFWLAVIVCGRMISYTLF